MRSLILLLALIPSLTFAQYQEMRMANPDRLWDNVPVDVHETVFEIHPKGNFSEIELFVSFAATDSNYFSQNELLEMFAFFELSDQITISDLWLWFEDQILVAHIIDRWTANRVYEGIVNRQQDPAILFKNSPTSYELRVYPFTRSQIRKLKISFLVPNTQLRTQTSIPLPTKFHQLAQNTVEDPVIRYFTEVENPALEVSDSQDATFTSGTDTLGRTYWEAQVDAESASSSLSLNVEKESTSNIFLSNYEDETGKYYSLSFIPKQVLDVTASKNIVVMLDYAQANTSVTKTELLDKIKVQLKQNFEETDYFNFLYSSVSDQVLSQDWIQATDAKIDSVFDEIDTSDILSVSNLDDILVGGIDFVSEKETGELMLISSSDTYIDFQDANAFSESILEYAENDLPKMTILDVQDKDFQYRYRNGVNYVGNGYLYGIFVRESGGELFNTQDYWDVNARFSPAFANLQGSITNYTVYPTFANGFTYANFMNEDSGKLPINSTFVQTGQYYGDLPLTIQFTGSIRDTVFNEQIVINESTEVDSSLKRYWMGRNIDKLEKASPNNEEIATIIDYSIENRLMSQYTSFLSILPEDTVLINDEDDGGEIVSIEDGDNPDTYEITALKAYPNPFNPNVNIEVSLSQPWDASNSRIVVYNLLGQVVATLNTAQYNGMKSFTVNWDLSLSNANIATGVYLVSVQTPEASKKIKVTYLK